MGMIDQKRFQFVREALEGSGGFRPVCPRNEKGELIAPTQTHLIPYPREQDEKFARRNQVAWYANDIAPACERFAGYMTVNPPSRTMTHDVYKAMADELDGQGNSQDVFWGDFIVQAKARGTMLLLVDMPRVTENTPAGARTAPYCVPIAPEAVSDYRIGSDGRFEWVEFPGVYTAEDGETLDVIWRFDQEKWEAKRNGATIDSGEHPCEECPVLIFTESGSFPCYGQFSQIADISRRLFNMRSELDEILRAQTFSVLSYPIPPEHAHLVNISEVAETIGTHNMLVHYGAAHGSAPAFIAPPDGPATIYLQTIAALQDRINEISLNVEMPNQQESGIALQMRFQALNSALSKFAERMEDLERRMWDVARKWCGLSVAPDVQWRRNYMLADVGNELAVLQQMQSSGMPERVIQEQMRRIISVQFGGLGHEQQEEIAAAIDESGKEIDDDDHNQD